MAKNKTNFNQNKFKKNNVTRGKGGRDYGKEKTNGRRGDSKEIGNTPVYNNTKDSANSKYVNDPAWYTNRGNTGLAGSYSFFYPIGTKEEMIGSQTQLEWIDGGINFGSSAPMSLPGICRIELQHTIGNSSILTGIASPGTRAINVGLNKIYSNIRHANSGAKNYEKSDMGIYFLCVADAYSFYGMCCRAYACMRKYSALNRYLAKPLVEAMGFDFDTLNINLPQFKTFINQFAMRLNVLCVPGNWPYFNRRYMLYSHVFVDEQSEKAQLYIFVPRYFLGFARDAQEGKGQCIAKFWNARNLHTLSDIETLGNALISDIILDNDFNIMSGDIAKYTDNLVHLPYMAEDYILDFTYDPLILSQIENATIEGEFDYSDGDVVVDQAYDAAMDDYLECDPVVKRTLNSSTFATTVFASKMKRLFNIHSPVYDEGMVLDATRLMNMPSQMEAKESTYGLTKRYDWCSTEVVSRLDTLDGVGNTWHTTKDFEIFANNMAKSTLTTTCLRQFNSHPNQPILWVDESTVPAKVNICGYSSNIDNYLIFDVQDMKRLHEAACLSLFDVN